MRRTTATTMHAIVQSDSTERGALTIGHGYQAHVDMTISEMGGAT